MSDSGFRSMNSLESDYDYADHPNFELSDYLVFDELLEEDPTLMSSGSFQNPISPPMDIDDSGKSSSNRNNETSSSRRGGNGSEKKKEVGAKVAFKTKSELEILDDGFRWRKYGKKMVKNSPNPRNYYRCSVQGCPVKKRVERDVEDPGYVITTYEGVHTHQCPSI